MNVLKNQKDVGVKGIEVVVFGSGYKGKQVNILYACVEYAREIPQGAEVRLKSGSQ